MSLTREGALLVLAVPLWETNRIGNGWSAANRSLAGSLARVLGHPVGLEALAARSTVSRAWAVVWAAVTTAAPFWLLPFGDDRELTWNALQQLPGNAYLLLALALGRHSCRRGHRPRG